MTQLKRALVAGVVGALILTSSGVGARETQFRQVVTVRGSVSGSAGTHQLTFSGPVALPGLTLAAGSYIFRRMGPHVLQVSAARDRTPYAMMLTTPGTRTSQLDRYEIVLGAPVVEGAPHRLEAWFAPGETFGQQLIYPAR
jgi:hypothetical protein